MKGHAMAARRGSKSRQASTSQLLMGGTSLESLGLHPRLTKVLQTAGRTQLPRVHGLAIPPALLGRDVLAQASPDADTVDAFVLPVVHHLLTRPPKRVPAPHAPRALLLAPSAKSGALIAAEVHSYGAALGLRRRVALARETSCAFPHHDFDMLVATPAGLLDLLHRGHLDLDAAEVMVLASFERMLSPACLSALGRVIHHLPTQRQVLLFHAGLPSYAQDLAKQVVRDPVRVVAAQQCGARAIVEQGVLLVANERKLQALSTLLGKSPVARALVFTRTRHAAVAVVRSVRAAGGEAEAMHEGVPDFARDSALALFREGRLPLLATTDASLREAETGAVALLVNYDMPSDVGGYVARVARVSLEAGVAISFCSDPERTALGRIERQLADPIPRLGEGFEPLPHPVQAPGRLQRADPPMPS